MSDTKKKFYLTTPIYYVNARPHIGHAYTTIAADVIARRHRLLGDDTFFLTGTDEHGQKIERSAAAAGIPPQQFADQVSAQFESLWKRMGITNDDYIRTTEPRHKRGVQKLFRTLQQNGFIELRAYTGQYCVSDETFVDVPVGAPCPECGRLTETVTEENYFFKLSHFQRQLIDLIESDTLAIQPDSRKNEVLSFLRGNVAAAKSTPPETEAVPLNESPGAPSMPESHPGMGGSVELSTAGAPYVPGALKDLSISRSSFKWGIPVPGDEKHVIYVWLDALANYMTAIGYGSDDPADQAKFEKYWPADLHLVGKEIIRFHCVYWPAFLLALNPELAGKQSDELPFDAHLVWAKKMLPKAITAHGWLLFEESKMSKSRGNIVRTETILDAFGTLCPPPSPAPTSGISTGLHSRVPAEAATAPTSGTSTGLQPGEWAPDENGALAPGSSSAGPDSLVVGTALAAEVSANARRREQDLFASDVLRYFLLREIPFGQDGSFSFDALVQRYNSDLANGYGNLVSRVLSMIDNNLSGVIPFGVTAKEWTVSVLKSGTALKEHAALICGVMPEEYRHCRFTRIVTSVQSLIGVTDTFFSEQAPWKLAKSTAPEDLATLQSVLYTAAESIRIITALLYPILPYATAKVWAQLGLGSIEQAARKGELKNLQWGGLKPGTKLGPLSPIFPRAPKELIQTMIEIEQNTKPAEPAGLPQVNNSVDKPSQTHTEFRESPISSVSATPALNPVAETLHPITEPPVVPHTPEIHIDDFVKIDLRVAKIVVAERIPKADKLLRLEVDLGYEMRQILSGIAEWYTPEELIGRNIVVIANLAPRKMRGLVSHGMLLAASHGDDGKPILATFAEDIALGSRLR